MSRQLNNYIYDIETGKSPHNPNIPLFDEGNMDFDSVTKKLDELHGEALKTFNDRITNYYPEWLEEIKNLTTGQIGQKQWYEKRLQELNLAMEVYTEAINFMHLFNKTLKSVKEDLFSSDHYKIAYAIRIIKRIYSKELTFKAGKLKRIKRYYKIEKPIIKGAIAQVDGIKREFDKLDEVSKYLGKTERQVEGMRKQSAAMRMRWGCF